MPFIVANYVYASSQGQRTHSARTKMPFVVATYVYASSQGQRTHSARTNKTFEVNAEHYILEMCKVDNFTTRRVKLSE